MKNSDAQVSAKMAQVRVCSGSRAPWMTADEGATYLGFDPRTLLSWTR